MCRPYSLKEFGSKILMIWFYPLNVHALRDTSPKLKDFIAYFFPKGFPQKEKYQIRKKSFSSFIGSKSSPLSTYSTKTNLKYDPNHARGHPYIYYAYYYYTTLWRRRKQGWKVSAEPSWGWRLQPTYNSSTSLYCGVCSLWGSSSSSSHRPSPLRTILYTFHKSNFDRVFSIVYHK